MKIGKKQNGTYTHVHIPSFPIKLVILFFQVKVLL